MEQGNVKLRIVVPGPVLGCRAANTLPTLPTRRPSPRVARGIQELPHLAAHVSEPRGGSENDGISRREFLHFADRDVGHAFLELQGPIFPGFLPKEFSGTAGARLLCGHLLGLRQPLGHAMDMPYME